MKTVMSFVTVVLFSATLAFAADAKPCKTIKQACESAGYYKGGHKKGNKGLYLDCMKPIMSGQTVAGVTVSQDDVNACKARKAKWKARHQANQQKNGS